jgi:hypothetical protein
VISERSGKNVSGILKKKGNKNESRNIKPVITKNIPTIIRHTLINAYRTLPAAPNISLTAIPIPGLL